MNRELEENLNNSYLVKRRLSTLRKLPGDRCYMLNIGDFQIRLFTNADYSEPPNIELPRVTDYKSVTIEIWETGSAQGAAYYVTRPSTSSSAIGYRSRIELSKDYRFADFYNDIKYTDNEWNWRNGKWMPVAIVCDLIKHVDRINELLAFH